ncbi:MAG TPA: CPBP family glutamic-type intramembrane protease [Candidatus Cloacimonadota bacterium]|nr:CPBP family glutamic-type intramembrane protease [Candidatus Cloacimonadota bacterium]
MMLSTLFAIIKKDLTEILRNKRAIISALFLPALFIPLLVFFQPLFDVSSTAEIHVALYDYTTNDASTNFMKALNADERFIIDKINPLINQADENKHDISILLHSENTEQNQLMIVYNSNSLKSQKAYEYITNILINSEVNTIYTTVTDINDFEKTDTQSNNSNSPFKAYPWVFLLFGFSGAAFIASEIVTGEKERHTLETLFSLQINRPHILIAKYFSILIFSVLSLLFNLLIMGLSIVFFNTMAIGDLLNEIFIVVYALFPALFLLSAILMHISLMAKSIHEARSIESVFFLFFSAIIIGTSFIELNSSIYLRLLPFVNSIIIIKEMHISTLTAIYLLISNFLPMLLLLQYGMIFITKDKVLDIAISPRKGRYKSLLPLILVLINYILFITIIPEWAGNNFIYRTLFTQFAFFLLPAILLLSLNKRTNKWLLFKKTPRFTEILLSSGFTIIIFFAINYYQSYFNSLFTSNIITAEKSLTIQGLWQSLLFMCLVPALSEELFFRAYLAEHWSRLGDRKGIFISAIIFALFHQNNNELFSLFILGIWFAYLAFHYRNIWLAIIAHFTNNLLVVIHSHFNLEFYKSHIVGICSLALLFTAVYLARAKKNI